MIEAHNKYFNYSKLTDKEKIYLSFIYLLEPFYIDKKGLKVRKKLRNFLGSTKADEISFLKKMEELGLIGKTGTLVSLKDNKFAKKLLDELIGNNKIDLDQVNNLFLD